MFKTRRKLEARIKELTEEAEFHRRWTEEFKRLFGDAMDDAARLERRCEALETTLRSVRAALDSATDAPPATL